MKTPLRVRSNIMLDDVSEQDILEMSLDSSSVDRLSVKLIATKKHSTLNVTNE